MFLLGKMTLSLLATELGFLW